MSLQPGTTLGVYEVLSAIGADGMGEPGAARNPSGDRSLRSPETCRMRC